ncbi:A-kinase anchor protein 10, mitochondrial [Bulinus truncatus]|nr:A-kinase anchor protein 10, mitochondrial [Bulinus truncatus]
MPLFKRKTSEKPAKSPSSGSGLIRTPSTRSSLSSPHSPSTPDSWGDESDIGVSYHAFNGIIPLDIRPRTLTLSESVLHDGPVIPDDSLESPLRTSSRLSKTLLEIVRDKDALSCFKAFLRSQKADHIIQFWCEAESFHASTLMRLRTQSLQSISKSAIHKRRCDSLKACCSPDTAPSGNTSAYIDVAPSLVLNSCCQNEAGCVRQLPDDSSNAEDCNFVNNTEVQKGQPPRTLCCQQPETSSNYISHNHCPSPSPSDTSITISRTPNCISSSACDSITAGQHVESKDCNDTVSTEATYPEAVIHTDRCSELPDASKSNNDASQEVISGKLKKSIERDAVTIFSTYLAKDAPKPIGVDDDFRAEAISKICKENGEVDPECFVSCQRFVLNKLEAEYYHHFKDSEFHCRHQVNLLTSEKVYLPDILLNENALCYFMEFMEQEGASDLMQMWLAADNFQQQLISTNGSYDGDQAQLDAMVIYDRYFSLQATNPIGFDDRVRFEIEENICRDGGPLPGCFTKAKNIVLKMIDKVGSLVHFRDLITLTFNLITLTLIG